jgi:YD repeat-containing protein
MNNINGFIMKKITKLVLLFSLIAAGLYGQNNNFLNRAPDFLNITTPNAASFGKFIDNPVSLYNGSVDISIPIYTLKDGSIELPVTLRYNTSGIKVNEEASWVGLGWNLNVGGVITQNVVGDYDDSDSNYNTILDKLGIINVFNPYLVPQFSNTWVYSFDSYIGSGNVGRSGRLNPDVFYYTYPGGAGKFVFDYRNDSIYILCRENAEKIEVVVRSNTLRPSIQEYKITTNSGIQHYFRYFTRIYSNNLLRTSSVSYVLYKSIYPNNQQVDYTYTSQPIRKVSRSDVFQANLSIIEDQCDLMGYSTWTPTEEALEGAEFYLSNIRTTNYQINFETSGRTDLMNGLRLNKIKIYPKDNINDTDKIKEFVFEYNYFSSDKNTIGWKPEVWNTTGMIYTESQNLQRLKLLAVYEQSNTMQINKYNFTYDPTQLPAKTSYSVDYWGNYNGQGGSSYLPDLKRLLWGLILANDEKSKKISEKYVFNTPYANRGYDYNFCKAGILTKITYPTGGTREIIYEPNSFTYFTQLPTATDYINTTTTPNYSVSLTDYNQTLDGVSKMFTIQENRLGKLEIRLSRGQHTGSYADGYFWGNLKGSSVTIVSMQNGNDLLYYDLTQDCHAKMNCFDNPSCDNSDPGAIEITVDLPSILTPGTYILIVNLTDNIPDQTISSHGPAFANLAASLILSPTTNATLPLKPQEVKGCGIRVAQVINDFGGNNRTTAFFEYSSGILHDVLQYIKVHDTYLDYSSSCQKADEHGQMLSKFFRKKEVVEVFGHNTMSNPYASIGGVGYSSVKEITKSNESDQGWTINEFSNAEPTSTQESVRIDNPSNGKPVRIVFYLDNNTVKKEIRYNYSFNVAHRYFGINFRKNINAFTSVYSEKGVSFNNPDLGNPFFADKQFTIIAHPLNAYDILLDGITTITDNVTETESYTYNPATLQLTSRKTLKSDGNHLEYRYFYPNDYTFAPYSAMKNAHILSPVIEEKIFNNGKYIGGSLTKYKTATQGGQTIYVPDKKYFSALSAPLTTVPTTFSSSGENTTVYPSANIKYENQTAYGKPQSITYNDSEQIVYLWGYNYQYPIAEIRNATYAQVRDALGGQTVVDRIANANTLSSSDSTLIRHLSTNTNLKNAMITAYTYRPLVGVQSITDPRGVVTRYNYDTFGRLQAIIRAGKQEEAYDYRYKNETNKLNHEYEKTFFSSSCVGFGISSKSPANRHRSCSNYYRFQ